MIRVTVAKDGSTKVEVDGVVGSSCKEMTKHLEQRLGNVKSVEEKPEMYQTHEQKEQQWQ